MTRDQGPGLVSEEVEPGVVRFDHRLGPAQRDAVGGGEL
jgi:hypothetical protein